MAPLAPSGRYTTLADAMRTHFFVLALALSGVGAATAVAQEVEIGGQIRPRAEFRDPVGAGGDGFVSMRVRAQISAKLDRHVGVFIQVQDVRLWGEETSTLADFNADNFDLHQGYLEVRSEGNTWVGARVGRQEVDFGGQRLVGAVDWAQQGRAFDGLRASTHGSWGSVDLIGFKVAEATSANIAVDAEFFGAYAQIANIGGGALDLYALVNHTAENPAGSAETEQYTLGARLAGRLSGVAYRVECSYQTGHRVGVDVEAFMFGARVGASIAGVGSLTLWYDHLSGDDDPTDNMVKVFDTLFATNHKYYGFADLFLNIPVHTGGLGLQDAAVKGSVTPHDDLTFNLDIHTFRLMKKGGLGSQHLGEEIDFTGNYRFSPNLTVTAGVSQVLSGDAFAALDRLSEDMTFAYLMLNATF